MIEHEISENSKQEVNNCPIYTKFLGIAIINKVRMHYFHTGHDATGIGLSASLEQVYLTL